MSARPALVVIDMQRIFAEPTSPWATPGFDHLLPVIDRLVDAYGDRAVFTRFLAAARPVGSWVPYYQRWSFALQPTDAADYQLVDHYAGGEPETVDATTFSKWGPDLADRTGADTPLVLAGVATECCVLTTALAAADAGRPVTVVADGCAGADEESHHHALQILGTYAPMIEVVGVEAALELARI